MNSNSVEPADQWFKHLCAEDKTEIIIGFILIDYICTIQVYYTEFIGFSQYKLFYCIIALLIYCIVFIFVGSLPASSKPGFTSRPSAFHIVDNFLS